MCQCYQIGGKFIAEDPLCPVHGYAAKSKREDVLHEIQRVLAGEIDAESAADHIADIYF